MSGLLSRRRMMIGVGGAVAASPLLLAGSASADVTGQLVVLTTPVRLYDSRTDAVPLGGAKLASGNAVIVTAGGGPSGALMAAFLNLTVTQTEGSGFLRVTGSDLSGERPDAKTSNINWFANNQTFGNLALTTVGGENGVQVFCGGNGKTHVVVDMMGFIPFIV
jgi:hypothetical protein